MSTVGLSTGAGLAVNCWAAAVGEDGGALRKVVGGTGDGLRKGSRFRRSVESLKGWSTGDGERCWR